MQVRLLSDFNRPQSRRRRIPEMAYSMSTAPNGASTSAGLEFCGVKCIGNAVLGAAKDVYELGGDAYNSTLNLPSHLLDAVNAVKHGVFDGWSEFVRLHGLIGKELLNGFNAVYEGVIEIGRQAWTLITEACRLFTEYKDFINIGIQVIQQDYANAAANLAQEATKAMGIDSPIDGTDSEIVKIAEFVCKAVDGVNLVTAIAAGDPLPPPLAPTSTLIVENGVARPMTNRELIMQRNIKVSFAGSNRVQPLPPIIRDPPAPAPPGRSKSIISPTVIVGASAAAALFILSR